MSQKHVSEHQQYNHLGLTEVAYDNLRNSGLSDDYIKLMRIQQPSKLKADQHDYYIPYFDFKGMPLKSFYRKRILRANNKPQNKYIQPAGSANHIWIPPNWNYCLGYDFQAVKDKPYLIITEGEKKAAAASQFGIPAVALGGVDSWKSRRVALDSKSIYTTKEENKMLVEIDDKFLRQARDQIAEGVVELIAHLQETNKVVYIIFDTDRYNRLRKEVQIAAFKLATYLYSSDVKDVRLAVLPSTTQEDKVGLDDFIVQHGPDQLEAFLDSDEHKFPTHPNVKMWVNDVLDESRVKRKTSLQIARSVIASLDSWGYRFKDIAGNFYYFDSRTKKLHTFELDTNNLRNFRLKDFSLLLNREFGIDTSDTNTLSRIADAYSSVKGIRIANPKRGVHTTNDALYYQLSDSLVAKVTKDRITVEDNGVDGVLFLSGQVEEITDKSLLVPKRTDKPRWIEILERTSVQPMLGMTLEETYVLLACLYYLNPWFRRWRGLMLPFEITIAEPNSGKSFMYNLRNAILTGKPTLQHAPGSMRDWYADLASTPAMWIGDNMGRLPPQLRNSMSDELARLITDPSPAVSMRKLYTNADNTRLPVDCTFAITAINNPFTREDIMQRSIIISMKAVPVGMRDGGWYNKEIQDGGRESWIIEHLMVAQKFLKLADEKWDPDYLSNHRLVNFEQSLALMAEVLGYEHVIQDVISKLTHVVQENIAQFNPVIEALRGYVKYKHDVDEMDDRFFATDIVEWANNTFDYTHVIVVKDARQLSRYMAQHEYDIHQSAGIMRHDKKLDGKINYFIDKAKAEVFLNPEQE